MGRPPKPDAEKRTVVILSKVTPSEAESVQRKANAANLPLSAWVRKTIVKAKS
jgi:hypothetical protein